MQTEIKKIGVWGTAKIFAILGLLTGIIMTFLFVFQMNSMIAQLSNPQLQAMYSAQGSSINFQDSIDQLNNTKTMMVFLVTPISIVLTAVLGIILALLFNLLSKVWGGIKITFEEKTVKK